MGQLVRRFAPGFGNVQLQHADLDIALPGGHFTQVTKIAYSAKKAVEEARGTSPLPQGVTRGALSYEASFSINRSFREEFRRLASVPGRGFLEGFFPCVISFLHPDWNKVESDTLYIMVTEWGFDSSSGPAVHQLNVPCYCGYIEFKSGGKVLPQFADIIGTSV